MKTPVSRLNDPDIQAVPVALMRASERARRLAEETGTRFVVRPPATLINDGLGATNAAELDSKGSVSLIPSGLVRES